MDLGHLSRVVEGLEWGGEDFRGKMQESRAKNTITNFLQAGATLAITPPTSQGMIQPTLVLIIAFTILHVTTSDKNVTIAQFDKNNIALY